MDKHILNQIKQTAVKAGAYIREESKSFDRSKVDYKGVNDMVSYVDKTCEAMIIDDLKKILPEASIIAEESDQEIKDSELTWIIDPLDGTTNFIHQIPGYAVSIGLARNNEVIAGVVYEVNRDECFSALKGEGAYLNDERISVSDVSELKDSLIGTGFPVNAFDLIPTFLGITAEIIRNTHGVRRIGSAAVDLAYVACGRFEAFFEFNLNAWDVSAGALLVQEAGGTVSDFKGGNDFLFGRQILAAGKIHPDMLKIIQSNM